MAEKIYKVKLTIPKCDSDDVYILEEQFSNFDQVKKIVDFFSKELGIIITWPKKGG